MSKTQTTLELDEDLLRRCESRREINSGRFSPNSCADIVSKVPVSLISIGQHLQLSKTRPFAAPTETLHGFLNCTGRIFYHSSRSASHPPRLDTPLQNR